MSLDDLEFALYGEQILSSRG